MKLTTPKNFTPIICPHCESHEISCLHKPTIPLAIRIMKILSTFLFLFFGVYLLIDSIYYNTDFSTFLTLATIASAVAYVALRIAELAIEYTSKITCVCRNCGSTWRHQ